MQPKDDDFKAFIKALNKAIEKSLTEQKAFEISQNKRMKLIYCVN